MVFDRYVFKHLLKKEEGEGGRPGPIPPPLWNCHYLPVPMMEEVITEKRWHNPQANVTAKAPAREGTAQGETYGFARVASRRASLGQPGSCATALYQSRPL